ncbi:MAG: hypothetical protein HC908_18635 [Calothrix sp. SM1_7_51]|nr:hypothetical protein [Calothrix sp. SM1_7_51]
MHRTAIGQIELQTAKKNGLELGCYRHLTENEICFLQKLIEKITPLMI